jgi:hypothetical protein
MNRRTSAATTATLMSFRLAAAALLLAAFSAAAGLLIPHLYRDSAAWVRQARAADLVTLFAVAPTLAGALWRARRGSSASRYIALGAVGYLVYNYAIFGFSVAINPMTPVHLAVLGLSVWSLVFGVIERVQFPPLNRIQLVMPRRVTAAFLVSIAAIFGLLWLGQIAQAITVGTVSAELRDLGLPTNPVYTLDLALALPFLVASGVALVRRSSIGQELALAALAWVVLMGLGVLAIFGFDAAAGAIVPVPVVILIAAITIIGLVLAGITLGGADTTRRRGQLEPRLGSGA